MKNIKRSDVKAAYNLIKKGVRSYRRNSDLSTKQIAKLIAKAEARLDEAEAKVKELESYGLTIDRFWSYDKVKSNIDKVKAKFEKKGKLSVMDVEYLRDLGKKRGYDDITRVKLPVPDQLRSNENMTVVKYDWFTVTKIEALARQEYRAFLNPEKKQLTEAQKMAVDKWTQAARVYKSSNEEILATEADVQRFLRQSRGNKANLDLSFGGQSALLNDLTYISRAKGDIGYDLITWLRGIMSDKTAFAKIEHWYQSPAGYELRQTINDATGANMYNGIQRISSMIEKLLDELAIEGIVSDEQIEDLYNKASAGVSGYMDNSY